ncbi:MAG TPA: hypothetical protein VIU64_11130, partial [Polyangia bacterium]
AEERAEAGTREEPPTERRERASGEQTPAADRGPVVATRRASAASGDVVASPLAADPSRYAVELGGLVLGSFEGLPPSLAPLIRGSVRLSDQLEARLSVAGLGTRARVQTPNDAVEATVAQSFGLLELVLGFRSGARLQPFLSLGAGADAVIAILEDAVRPSAELRVIDRATGKTVTRQVPAPASSSRAAEILSIRSLELLRASLLDVARAASEPKARATSSDVRRTSASATAPVESAKRPEPARSVGTAGAAAAPRAEEKAATGTREEPLMERRERASGEPPPAADRGPVVATRRASAPSGNVLPSPLAADPFRYAVELGGVLLGSFEGLPPSVAPLIRGSVRLSDQLEARLSVAGLGTRARVQTANDAVEATVAQSFGLLELVLGFRSGARLQPFLSLGAGAAHISVDGRARSPYESHAGALWFAIADAGLGVRVGLGHRFQLAAEAHAQGAYPYPVVSFMDTTLAQAGRPTVLGTLSLIARL